MATLVILNIPRELSDRMHRLVERGDEAAERWFQDLWSDYAGPLECFLCAAAIEKDRPLATVIIPDRRAMEAIRMTRFHRTIHGNALQTA